MLHCQLDNLSISVPGDWSELTLGQYLAYIASQTDAEALAALSGLSVDKLRQSPDLHQILPALSYLDQVPDFKSLSVPAELFIDGKVIQPISNLSKQSTFGQMCDTRQVAKQLGADPTYITMARTLLSVYLYPTITGKPYNDLEQTNTIIPLIDAIPVYESLPLAYSLFNQWLYPKPSGRLRITVVPPTPAKKTKQSVVTRLWESLKTF